MADKRALYSTCVAVLGFICFVVGATAVGLPMWGYFDSPGAGAGAEKGYFGPWKTCKLLLYNRERCGKDESRFRTSIAVWVAGVVASLGVVTLGLFCVLSVLQLAMVSSKERVVMNYSVVVIGKLALGLLATLLAIAAAGLFALEVDDRENGFQITRGPAFYIQVLLILLNAILFVMSVYDMLFSRRQGGDPTKGPSSPVDDGTTYGNPGYRDQAANASRETKLYKDRNVRQQAHLRNSVKSKEPTSSPAFLVRGGISMTDASGKPYVRGSAAANGSMASMNTTLTLASSNGSTAASSVTRSPLRSSLKKPRQKDGLGIQNPGFSGTSPTLSRNGSVKKVRIQTHSTEV